MEKQKFQINDLKKENILKVPEGYFEYLPMRIQSRIEKPKSIWEHATLSFSLKYALPAIAIVLIAYFGFLRSPSIPEYEAILNEISTEDIVDYLAYSDVTTDEILNNFDLEMLSMEITGSDDIFFEDEDIDDQDLIDIYEELEVNEFVEEK